MRIRWWCFRSRRARIASRSRSVLPQGSSHGKGGPAALGCDRRSFFPQKKNSDLFRFFCSPSCLKIQSMFQDMGVNAKVIELNQMPEGPDVQSALLDLTGQRTVPNVFIGGNHVGGCDDVMDADASGELAKMLEAAGVEL
mmetsp:Transcript_24395/g.60854  ORF Transcript_24395/g.60854 Transcript_24395/m.60854 type:complete len:140 (+) Transcript_24395:104-523(+)